MSGVGRVLGIDPGLNVTGWGVIEPGPHAPRLLAFGTIRPRRDDATPARLVTIHQGVLEVIATYAPAAVSVEDAFVGRNQRSAIRLGEARAVCLLAAALAGAEVHELPPALVKKSVAGHGRATKDGIREAVVRALPEAGEGSLPHDAADALALALTALIRLETPEHLRPSRLGRRPRRRRWTLADLPGEGELP